MNEKNLFETLSKINCNEHVEDKNGLTYLSWAWAWTEFKKVCPNATYEVWKNENNVPFIKTAEGYMVFTKVTPGAPWNEDALEMWLPVMDNRNNAVKEGDMMAINKTIMRCLTKNLSMFGLGAYIYAGQDLPEEERSYTTSKISSLMKEVSEATRRKAVILLEEKGGLENLPGDDLKKMLAWLERMLANERKNSDISE